MGIEDFVPVFFFYRASCIIKHNFKNELSKPLYLLLSIGLGIMYTSGFLKATHKLLLNANICDIKVLKNMFAGVSSFGNFLCGFAIFHMLNFSQKEVSNWVYIIIPILLFVELISKKMIQVLLNVIGVATLSICMSSIAFKAHKPVPGVLFLTFISFAIILGMLHSKINSYKMNWIGQAVNTVGLGALYLAAYLLYKKDEQK